MMNKFKYFLLILLLFICESHPSDNRQPNNIPSTERPAVRSIQRVLATPLTPNFIYNGTEDILKGKEKFISKDPDFLVHQRYTKMPKDEGACQFGQGRVIDGFTSFFEALKIKNDASISLSLGPNKEYDDMMKKYGEMYPQAKIYVIQGSDVVFKACGFEKMLCFVIKSAEWRKEFYRRMVASLRKKLYQSRVHSVQKTILLRINYVMKKVILLDSRLDRRIELAKNLRINCG